KLEEKDSEIVDLQYEVKDLAGKVSANSAAPLSSGAESSAADPAPVSAKGGDDIIRVRASAEKVQTALKNAGFYTGKVDGKIGAGTKAAIIEFQRSNGLAADGVVGRKTWEALKKNL
ncbi:MAG: peptidoglycan-binding protein, partial [Candidatus Omnitrophica bacterium]|nr:peptidoglycan-binding protein [Candidatus Omnitrophota bacterium]